MISFDSPCSSLFGARLVHVDTVVTCALTAGPPTIGKLPAHNIQSSIETSHCEQDGQIREVHDDFHEHVCRQVWRCVVREVSSGTGGRVRKMRYVGRGRRRGYATWNKMLRKREEIPRLKLRDCMEWYDKKKMFFFLSIRVLIHSSDSCGC